MYSTVAQATPAPHSGAGVAEAVGAHGDWWLGLLSFLVVAQIAVYLWDRLRPRPPLRDQFAPATHAHPNLASAEHAHPDLASRTYVDGVRDGLTSAARVDAGEVTREFKAVRQAMHTMEINITAGFNDTVAKFNQNNENRAKALHDRINPIAERVGQVGATLDNHLSDHRAKRTS